MSVCNPHIRRRLLDATRPLRKKNGCNNQINEHYLFHGLGNPAMALNIINAGINSIADTTHTPLPVSEYLASYIY